MGQTIITVFIVLTVLFAVWVLCKTIWMEGNAKGFKSGYAEGRKAKARANGRRRGARNLKERKQLKSE